MLFRVVRFSRAETTCDDVENSFEYLKGRIGAKRNAHEGISKAIVMCTFHFFCLLLLLLLLLFLFFNCSMTAPARIGHISSGVAVSSSFSFSSSRARLVKGNVSHKA